MSNDRGTQTNKHHKVSLTEPSTSRGTAKQDETDEPSDVGSVSIEVHGNAKTIGLSSSETVYSCGFEVFGIVQGVSFRMYTLRRAQKLGVRGWVQNTTTNTVIGEIEGHYNPFENMRLWLRYTGSPTSRIDKVVFSDTTECSLFKFERFTITGF